MFCLACIAPSNEPVCPRCITGMRPAPDTVLGDGLLVFAAYTHEGPSRVLIHAMKYRGVAAAALPFATRLAERIPPTATCLVPVPRATLRAIRYGVDPAQLLARRLARLSGLPVVPALRPPLWWRRHAGTGREDRAAIRFRQRFRIPPDSVLIDDVVTTGATVTAAAAALTRPPSLVLAATVAPRIGRRSTPVEAA